MCKFNTFFEKIENYAIKMSFVCWFLLIEAYHRLYTLYLVNSSPLHGRTFRIKQLQHDYRDWQQCWSSWDLYKDVVREVLFYFTKTTQKRLPFLGLKWLMPLRLLAFSFLRGIKWAWMNMLTIVTFFILKCFFGENTIPSKTNRLFILNHDEEEWGICVGWTYE